MLSRHKAYILIYMYYEVAIEYTGLKAKDWLTYSYDQELEPGRLVRVPLRNSQVNGVVVKKVSKPNYKTKDIQQVFDQSIPTHLIDLAKWVAEYYASDLGSVIRNILPRGLHKNRRQKQISAPDKVKLHKPNARQSTVLNKLKKMDRGILHGVTGSGKTLVYIKRAEQLQKQDLGSIILVPEIGLTSQMLREFSVLDNTFVLHSELGEAERHLLWLEIQKSKAPIVIGPRSALFAPIKNLGLIVVDEAHETSYKQDQTPRYHAVRVASKLAEIAKAQLVLGTATPRIEDYYLAKTRKAPIIPMTKPVKDVEISSTDIVDLKHANMHSHIFSMKLKNAIDSTLNKGQQVMLFHNRRGTSTSIICSQCGWISLCPNCHLPLTHHADWHQTICHICGFSRKVDTDCPECGQPELIYKGFGTKQIEAEAKKLFKARIARFDSDSKSQESLHKRYSELREGKVDIIIGTQMIAKGLDLPKLSLVGVVLADTALYMPDYSSNERTFQLLYQVGGRIGRHQNGQLIVQTYTPKHPAIVAALKRDYLSFYKSEIEERKLTKYPPFSFLLQLVVTKKQESTAKRSAEALVRKLPKNMQILGPSPAFHAKSRSGFHWQIVIKSSSRQKLVEIARDLPNDWQFDLDPINLL